MNRFWRWTMIVASGCYAFAGVRAAFIIYPIDPALVPPTVCAFAAVTVVVFNMKDDAP